MSLQSVIGKIGIPSPKDIVTLPKKIKNDAEKVEQSKIIVRFFTSDFSEVIEIVGFKTNKTSIPLVYFETTEKLGCIALDGCIYFNKTTNQHQIDVCEDYLFGLAKNVELFYDLNKEYYNNISDSEKAKMQKTKLGYGYYIPVLLNKIPREVIKVDLKKKLNSNDIRKIEITQYIIRQLGTVRMLERLEKKDNSILIACFFMFVPIGFVIGAVVMAYLLG